MAHRDPAPQPGFTPGRGQKQPRPERPRTKRAVPPKNGKGGATKRRPAASATPAEAERAAQQRGSRPAQNRRPLDREAAYATPPRRPGDDGHAPIYDQDEGHRNAPVPGRRPDTRKARREAERHRLTKAEVRRRRRRRTVTTVLLLLILIFAGVGLTILLLFKVQKFEIQTIDGQTPADTGVYSSQEIIDSLAIPKGDNIFSFRVKDKTEALNAAFPLLEQVKILRRLPDTLVIRVEPAAESFCIQTEAGWAVLSRHLKVISLSGEQPALPVIAGTAAAGLAQGDTLALDTEENTAALNELIEQLDAEGLLADTTEINLIDSTGISIVYQGRIRAELGSMNSIRYKLDFVTYILENKNGEGCSETASGVLNASHIRTDGTIRPTFTEGDPNAVQPTPEPAPEPADSAPSAASAASSAAAPAA